MRLKQSVLRKLSIACFFVFGSCAPVLNSVILRDQYPWRNGLKLQFRKPWFQLTAMFFGMTAFVIPLMISRHWRSKHFEFMRVSWTFGMFRKVALPALCNFLATGLQIKALMYIPTTVWQVFFGFQVLFATLFAVTYRRQQLLLVDWLGLFISVAGMSFSGVATLLRGIEREDNQTISNIFFSFIIVILSHGVQAFQTIIEEKLLHDEGINTATLTAFEGIWGLYISIFIVLPFCGVIRPTGQLELYENTLETLEMMKKSGRLVGLVIGYVLLVTGFSFSGIAVTEFSSAIHRNMYEMVRPLPVWILSFTIYYISKNEALGEPLDKFTALELGGFIVSAVGSLIYNRVLKFPCFVYIEEERREMRDRATLEGARRPRFTTKTEGKSEPAYRGHRPYTESMPDFSTRD